MADKEADKYAIVPEASEAKLIGEYAGYIGESGMHDAEPIRPPMLRWKHMGAATADAEGGKFYNSLEGNDVAYDSIPAVVIDGKNSRVYYREAYDPKKAKAGEQTGPDCKSDDGITGVGDPGGECKLCPLAQWHDNKPPRCALSYDRLIYDFHTHQLGVMSFARTKIKALTEFERAIKARNSGQIPVWGYKVVIHSERRENYWVPKFEIEGVLPKDVAIKFFDMKKESNDAFLRSPSASIAVSTDDDTAPVVPDESKDLAGAY